MSKTLPHPTTDTIESVQRDAEILWLVPDKSDNISIGRNRIGKGLEKLGYTVTQTAGKTDVAKAQLSNRPDVIMGTTSIGGTLSLPAQLTGSKFIVDHVDPISQMYRTNTRTKARCMELLEDLSFRVADGICYVYDKELDRFPGRTPAVKTSLGVDYDRFQLPKPDSRMQIDALLANESVSEPFAVYIGGFEPIYNIERILKAASGSDFELVLAGTGSLNQSVARAARANENITNLGLIDHELVPALLERASAGLCMVDDPHTVKTLEYGAANLPIIHAKGRAEGVIPSEGVTFANPTGRSIRDAVEDVLDEPPATAELNQWAKSHRWSAVVADYDHMIQTVL